MDNNLVCIVGMGQDGFYLTKYLHSKGYKVTGVVRRSSQPRNNLKELIEEGLEAVEGDVTDAHSMNTLVNKYKPSMLFNLSAMSHVHTSFNSPSSTFEINTLGVVNILEAIRLFSPSTRMYQASTSEMFGSNYSMLRKNGVVEHFDIKKLKPDDLPLGEYEGLPFQSELTPFGCESPYAISKLAAHNFVKLYRESYGLFCCSGILFNHDSEQRGENFVTRKITKYIGRLKLYLNNKEKVVDIRDALMMGKDVVWKQDPYEERNRVVRLVTGLHFPKLQLGNLNSKRDFSHSSDVVRAMVSMLCNEKPVDYVVGSGKTYSIKEFLDRCFKYVGLNWEEWVEINPAFIRPAEVDLLCSDPSKANNELGWKPLVSLDGLIKRMIDNDMNLAKIESAIGVI